MFKDKTSPKLIFIRIAKVSMGVLKMESVFGVSSCFLESLFMRLSFFYGTIFHIADEIKNIKGGRNMDTNYKY